MGLGIVRLNEFIVSTDIRDGRLKALLMDARDIDSLPSQMLYLRARHRLPRVAAMLEVSRESFGHSPWRIGSTQPLSDTTKG